MSAVVEQIVLVDEWRGLYGESWKGVIVDEAFAHPAKFSRALIRRIYDHVIAEGWATKGLSVIDPFGGVALGAFDAMRHGLNWTGCELEQKFVELGGQNIALWNERFSRMPNWGRARLLRGDSRKLAEVLRAAGCCVSSPPYADFGQNQGTDNKRDVIFKNRKQGDAANIWREGYGSSEGQLGALKEGSLASVLAALPRGDCPVMPPPNADRALAKKFFKRVRKGLDCWNWTGKLRPPDNYGKLLIAPKTEDYAHRISWLLHYGPIPNGLCVLHKCDNPPCVRPDHLFLGTKGDNWRDCVAKGRAWMTSAPLKGEDNGFAKLSNEQAREIYRKYHAGGYTLESLGEEYGVSRHPIWMIVKGRSFQDALGAMKEGDHSIAISSPPYSGIEIDRNRHEEPAWERQKAFKQGKTQDKNCVGSYGKTDGQLGAMPEGQLCVTSPPFESSTQVNNTPGDMTAGRPRWEGGTDSADRVKQDYVDYASPENLGNMRGGFQSAISSPPYEDQDVGASRRELEKYDNGEARDQRRYGNLGSGETFWSASRLILEQLHQVLAPNAHAVFVVKAFVRDKKIVDFPAQWAQLCEAVGFKLLHDHHALLVEHSGTQGGFDEDKEIRVERKSFFRRLAESKGSPRIDHENVLCLKKV